MADNPYEYIKDESPALAAKLDENFNVCEFLVGVYRQLEETCNEIQSDPKLIKITVDVVQERLLRVMPQYPVEHKSHILTPDRKPAMRMLNIVHYMTINPDIRDIAKKVVMVLEAWIQEKEYRKSFGFKDVKIVEGQYMRGDKSFIGELIMKVDFDDFVREKMNWTDQPGEEQPSEHDVQLAADIFKDLNAYKSKVIH